MHEQKLRVFERGSNEEDTWPNKKLRWELENKN